MDGGELHRAARLVGGRPLRLLGVAVGLAGVALFELRAHASTFTERDSINLARGFLHYDVRLHQPHPPGYPLVVLSAHGLHWLGSILNAYLTFDLIASLAAVGATCWLARTMFGARAGVIAGALLLATPLFLYYAEIVSVYPSEEAFAPLVALLAYRTATRADHHRSAFLLLPALGLGAGFRPTMLGLLLPVCLVGLALGRPRIPTVLAGAGVAALIVLAWLIPMLNRSGGLHGYDDASSKLYGDASAGTSILHGATLHEALDNIWTVGAGTVLTVLPGLLLVAFFARRFRRSDTVALLILAAWVVPYVLLYTLGHFGKPGYVLAYVPALYVAAAGFVSRVRLALPAALGLAAVVLAVFLTADHFPLPGPLARRTLPPFLPTAAVIALEDREARSLERMAPTCPATSCTIVSLPGTRLVWDHSPAELKHWYAPGSRIVSYYGDRGALLHVEGDVLWVGTRIPASITEHAHPVGAAGSWRYLRSNAAVTDEILAPLRPGS